MRNDKSCKVHGKVASKSSLQDQQGDGRAPEEEYFTFISFNEADVTSVQVGQYNILLQTKVTVPQRTPKEENGDEMAACHVYVHIETTKGVPRQYKLQGETSC